MVAIAVEPLVQESHVPLFDVVNYKLIPLV